MIQNIQLLRVLAALVVVYFHIASEAGMNLPLAFGRFGVDVFFVVSGFIIAYIGKTDPGSFMLRRLIRIVPFYWSATFFVFGIAWCFPELLRQTRADFNHLICSLLFIPHENGNSGLFPTLVLGWSLNYEMFFYIVFAFALLLSRRLAPVLCSVFITGALVSIVASGTESEAIRFYAQPIVFEFVYGIGVFYLVTLTDRRAKEIQRIPWLKSLLLGSILAASALIVVQEVFQGFGLSRHIASGLPALVIVAAAILLEKLYGFQIRSRLVFVLGESSYILYLIHPYVIYGVLRLLIGPTAGSGSIKITLLIAFLLLLPSAMAVAIHLWFERPVMSRLRKALLRPEGQSWRRLDAPILIKASNSA